MTHQPNHTSPSSITPRQIGSAKRQLPLAQAKPSLARHPKDGWVYADPYPMSARYLQRLHLLIRLLCPGPPAPMSDALVSRIERHVRGFMMYMPALAARGLWLSFILLDWSPRLLFTSARRLSQLPREKANQVLSRITSSRFMPLRLLVVGIRGSVLSAYFDQEEVHELLGYSPIPFIQERIELRQQLLHNQALAAE